MYIIDDELFLKLGFLKLKIIKTFVVITVHYYYDL